MLSVLKIWWIKNSVDFYIFFFFWRKMYVICFIQGISLPSVPSRNLFRGYVIVLKMIKFLSLY